MLYLLVSSHHPSVTEFPKYIQALLNMLIAMVLFVSSPMSASSRPIMQVLYSTSKNGEKNILKQKEASLICMFDKYRRPVRDIKLAITGHPPGEQKKINTVMSLIPNSICALLQFNVCEREIGHESYL